MDKPQPRCPFCNAQGVKNIAARNLGQFALIYCAGCGAIHGVVPAQKQPEKPKQMPAQTDPAPAAPTPPKPLLKTQPLLLKKRRKTPEQPDPLPRPDKKPPVKKPYRTPGVPDPLPRQEPRHAKPKPAQGELSLAQLEAMLAASKGGLFHHIFTGDDDDQDEDGD